MTASFYRRVRTTQPQQNVQIDWSNPVTAGLVFAYTMGNEAVGWGEDGRSNIQYVKVSDGSPFGRCINTLSGTAGQVLSATSGYLFASPTQTSIKSGAYSLFAFGTSSSNTVQSAIDDDNGSARRFQFRFSNGKAELIPFYNGGNGSVTAPVALSAYDLANGFAMGATVNGTAYAIFQKGVKTAGTTLPSTALTPNSSIAIGVRSTQVQQWLVGGLMLVAMWNRPLTDAEHASLSDNPWQLFKPAARRMLVPNTAVTQRALIMSGGVITQIVDALIGANKKPLVMYQGGVQERVASEGVPIVVVNGEIRTLAANETLLI